MSLNITKTQLLLFIIGFGIGYLIFSQVLINYYYDAQITNIENKLNISIDVTRIVGIPIGLTVNGLDNSFVPESALQKTSEAFLLSLINIVVVLILIILGIWLIIPTGT